MNCVVGVATVRLSRNLRGGWAVRTWHKILALNWHVTMYFPIQLLLEIKCVEQTKGCIARG